jgi:hypothetical protein
VENCREHTQPPGGRTNCPRTAAAFNIAVNLAHQRVGALRALVTLLRAEPGEQLSRSLRGLHASTSLRGLHASISATGRFAPGSTKPTPCSNGVDPPYVAKLSANRPAPVIMDEDELPEPAVRALAYLGVGLRCVCG